MYTKGDEYISLRKKSAISSYIGIGGKIIEMLSAEVILRKRTKKHQITYGITIIILKTKTHIITVPPIYFAFFCGFVMPKK